MLGNADASDRRSGWSAAEIDEMEGEDGKGGGREEGGEERRAGLKTDTLGVCPRDKTPSLTTGQLSSHLF